MLPNSEMKRRFEAAFSNKETTKKLIQTTLAESMGVDYKKVKILEFKKVFNYNWPKLSRYYKNAIVEPVEFNLKFTPNSIDATRTFLVAYRIHD